MQLKCLISFKNCIIRQYSLNINHNASAKKFEHPFKHILSKSSVLKHLAQNIIYQDDNIVAFNKPAGVAKAPPAQLTAGPGPSAPVYMEHLMNDVAQLVPQFKELSIVKFPERHASGVMILAGSQQARLKVDKCKRRAKGGSPADTYVAVSQACPIIQENQCKLAIRLAQNEANKRKTPVLEEDWTNWDTKKQRIKLFRVAHSVVSVGSLASLTRVSVTSAAHNSIRLYFATKLLSPLLGDHIFSGRVKDVLGVPLLLDPWSDVANSPKVLPTELLQALRLSAKETPLVPLCVHLEEVRLPGYTKEDLVLRAPLPDTFSWVCQQLGVSYSAPQAQSVGKTKRLISGNVNSSPSSGKFSQLLD